MTVELLDPVKERERLLLKARDIAANAEAAARDLTADEYTELETLVNGAKAQSDIIRQRGRAKRLTDEVGELLKAEEAGELNEAALRGTERGLKAKAFGLGESFVKSDVYAGLKERFPNGIPDQAKGIHTDPVAVPGGLKALVTSGGTGGSADYLVEPQRLGLVAGLPEIPLMLRDLVTVGTTNTDRIEYAQVNEVGVGGTVNGAKTVAEATTADPAKANTTTGVLEPVPGSGVKPQSALSFRKASADVITVANWMPITKRALSDAAQIRTIIDGFLRRNIARELDRLILNGDADSPVGDEEWNGILNTTGVQNQAFATDLPTTFRKAISKVTNLNGQINGVLVAPEADEALDLMKDANGRYFGGGPFQSGPKTIWGLPRVVVPALAGTGKFILGDFGQCVLWDREQAGISVTDAHADFFTRNLLAILAEARAAFGIFNPSLLVVGATA